MRLDEYQKEAGRTAYHGLPSDMELAVAALGLAGEAGEVVDHIKKALGHGHVVDWQDVAHELGDVLWYIARLASIFGVQLEKVAEMNLEKLEARYPDGFSSERSINR